MQGHPPKQYPEHKTKTRLTPDSSEGCLLAALIQESLDLRNTATNSVLLPEPLSFLYRKGLGS